MPRILLLSAFALLGACSSSTEAPSPSPAPSSTAGSSSEDASPGCAPTPETDASTGPQRTPTPVEQCTGGYQLLSETAKDYEYLHSDGVTCFLGASTELHKDGTAVEGDRTGTWTGDVEYFSVTLDGRTYSYRPIDPMN